MDSLRCAALATDARRYAVSASTDVPFQISSFESRAARSPHPACRPGGPPPPAAPPRRSSSFRSSAPFLFDAEHAGLQAPRMRLSGESARGLGHFSVRVSSRRGRRAARVSRALNPQGDTPAVLFCYATCRHLVCSARLRGLHCHRRHGQGSAAHPHHLAFGHASPFPSHPANRAKGPKPAA